jgi:phospholipid transport system substrate-binding protein
VLVALLLALAVLFVSGARAEAAAGDSPRAVVEALHAGLVAAAASSESLQQRYLELRPLIAATHDLAYIAELTIRRQWRELEPADRERFVAAFERLSVTTYASRFDAVGETSFKILQVADAGNGRVQVGAAIARDNGADIPLDYTLEDRGQGWRIVNIFADGVSDLALKRAEYQRILATGTIATLTDELQRQSAGMQ